MPKCRNCNQPKFHHEYSYVRKTKGVDRGPIRILVCKECEPIVFTELKNRWSQASKLRHGDLERLPDIIT